MAVWWKEARVEPEWIVERGATYRTGWRPAGWAGQLFYLGDNKEIFDAEVCAVYQALEACDENSVRYTVFSDSTAALGRA